MENTTTKTSTALQIRAVLGKFQSVLGLAAVFLAASVICVRGDKNLFLQPNNLANVVRSISENGIIAIGMTLVILIGGIDLSVGALVGLTATAAADLMAVKGMPMALTLLIVLGLAIAFGIFNGVISTKLGVQSFIVTLAAMSVARGLARFWSGGIGIPIAYGDTPGMAPPAFSLFGERIYGVPVPALCFLIITLVFSVLLKYTKFGRHVYAIGGNETSAYLCGVKVDGVKILVFTLCGLLAGFAGIIHAAQLSQGSPNDGTGYELNAIAAVAIGGASMSGGKGVVIGTVMGALILGILDNMLGLKNIDNNMQLIVKGLIIVVAVVLQREKKR
jgi:ribose transport system permease protein